MFLLCALTLFYKYNFLVLSFFSKKSIRNNRNRTTMTTTTHVICISEKLEIESVTFFKHCQESKKGDNSMIKYINALWLELRNINKLLKSLLLSILVANLQTFPTDNSKYVVFFQLILRKINHIWSRERLFVRELLKRNSWKSLKSIGWSNFMEGISENWYQFEKITPLIYFSAVITYWIPARWKYSAF